VTRFLQQKNQIKEKISSRLAFQPAKKILQAIAIKTTLEKLHPFLSANNNKKTFVQLLTK
jgi:hypothetical protein